MPESTHTLPPLSAIRLASQMWFSCPSCKGELKVPLAMAGTTAPCPLCGERVAIPHAEAVRPAQPVLPPPGLSEIDLDGKDEEAEVTNLFTKVVKVPVEYSIGHPCRMHLKDHAQPVTVSEHETGSSGPPIKGREKAGSPSSFIAGLAEMATDYSIGHPCQLPQQIRRQPAAAIENPEQTSGDHPFPGTAPEPPIVAQAPMPAPEPPIVAQVLVPAAEPPIAAQVLVPAPEPPIAAQVPMPAPEPPTVAQVLVPAPEPPIAAQVPMPAPEPPIIAQVPMPAPDSPVCSDGTDLPSLPAVVDPELDSETPYPEEMAEVWAPATEPAQAHITQSAPAPLDSPDEEILPFTLVECNQARPEHLECEVQQPATQLPPQPFIPKVIQCSNDAVDDEEHRALRIGGVLLPHFTRVPRANRLMVWAQRWIILAVILSIIVWLSDFYMPQVHRIAAWLDEASRSRVHLSDIQNQIALNRSSPAAQGFEEDAFAALRQEWTKFTSPAPRPPVSAAKTRQVVFRSARTVSLDHNPASGWPQMLLRNHGAFHGHSALDGASSFLLEAGNGTCWIATSAHLLGSSGGVEPPVNPGRLSADLERWQAHLPNQRDAFAEVTGGGRLVSVVTADWLAMQLPAGNAPLPVKPLKLRRTLLANDEAVFLIGLPYDDATGASQHVYRGQVLTTSRTTPSQFVFSVDAPVDFAGFSGAPVLDTDGLVVGVVTDRTTDLLIGTRAELLAQLLEAK